MSESENDTDQIVQDVITALAKINIKKDSLIMQHYEDIEITNAEFDAYGLWFDLISKRQVEIMDTMKVKKIEK